MLGQGDGAGDEQIGVFEQDHEVMALRGFRLVLGTDGGDGQPALFDGTANAVLVVLGEAMPEGWALFVAIGELGYRPQERGQLFIAGAHGGAGRAVGIQRPQKQREQGSPCPARQQQQGLVESHMPVGGGRAYAADEDDLDEKSCGGKRLAEDGEVAPDEAEKDGRRQRQVNVGAGDGPEEESGCSAQRERCKARHACAIGASGVGEDSLEPAQGRPTHVGDAG